MPPLPTWSAASLNFQISYVREHPVDATPFSTPDISRLLTLFARQVREAGFRVPPAADFDNFVDAQPDLVLFFAGDPRRTPETWDVAVVLPDILAPYRDRLQVGLLDPALAERFATRYGVTLYPTLVFLRHGAYLGAIERMRDWDYYEEAIRAVLASDPAAVPGTHAKPASDVAGHSEQGPNP